MREKNLIGILRFYSFLILKYLLTTVHNYIFFITIYKWSRLDMVVRKPCQYAEALSRSIYIYHIQRYKKPQVRIMIYYLSIIIIYFFLRLIHISFLPLIHISLLAVFLEITVLGRKRCYQIKTGLFTDINNYLCLKIQEVLSSSTLLWWIDRKTEGQKVQSPPALHPALQIVFRPSRQGQLMCPSTSSWNVKEFLTPMYCG